MLSMMRELMRVIKELKHNFQNYSSFCSIIINDS